MSKYVQITDEQVEFLRQYPHPWSFLGMRRSDFILPEWIDSSLYSYISLRVAENCIDGSIRDTLVYPLWLTSANLSGKLESKTLSRAREFFPGVDGIDGGLCDQLPSDIFGI
jgi:tRNA A37 threonylcarbamoyladenosine synthetase subunit TsaC/SUA5/YrdC